jgi:hypothetical protein
VEQRADDFVRDQLGQLASIDTTLDVAGCVRERLSRLYRAQRREPEAHARFDEIVTSGLEAVPNDIRVQRIPEATWPVWLAKHRELARDLEAALGLPGQILVREQHVGHGQVTPVRG